MALKQTHHLRQAQSLVMTPKLQQSIQLLEMTNHQLNAFIKDEIEKNPFLDEVINVLDETGREKLVEVLLGEDLNTYVVSHGWTHPLLEKVEVVKSGNISKLEH